MQVVLDANLIAAMVLPLPYSNRLKSRLAEMEGARVTFTGPALWSYEVMTVLRKFIAAEIVPADRVELILQQIRSLDIVSIPNTPDLQHRALAWAERLGQPKAYDGAYLAAAESQGAEFWTADRRLVEAAGVDWVRGLGD